MFQSPRGAEPCGQAWIGGQRDFGSVRRASIRSTGLPARASDATTASEDLPARKSDEGGVREALRASLDRGSSGFATAAQVGDPLHRHASKDRLSPDRPAKLAGKDVARAKQPERFAGKPERR